MTRSIFVTLAGEVDDVLLAEALVARFPSADIVISDGAHKDADTDLIEVVPYDELVWEEAVWVLQKLILSRN